MRPLRPFCGTVSNAQLLTLPATIRISANGVVTTQLSLRPPASSSATEVAASSDSRPATAQPPDPAPTTTKSNVSLTQFPQSLLDSSLRGAKRRSNSLFPRGGMDCFAPLAMTLMAWISDYRVGKGANAPCPP